MKKIPFLMFALPVLCISFSAFTQSDEEMKAMMAYGTPGDMHKMLSKSAGAWTANTSMWWKPGGPVQNSTGQYKDEMTMGGRYLVGKYSGNFNGMPYEGVSVTGYDNARKEFFNTWMDNMGTGMMMLRGTWDAGTKSINFSGTMMDPTTGKDVPVREVLTIVDDKTHVLDMYAVDGGKEFKTMEIKFTRQ